MSLAIQANYMGDYGKDGHWVAIKQEKTDDTEKSTKIRKFNTAEAAQSYVNLVNETGEDVFIYNENNSNNSKHRLKKRENLIQKWSGQIFQDSSLYDFSVFIFPCDLRN